LSNSYFKGLITLRLKQASEYVSAKEVWWISKWHLLGNKNTASWRKECLCVLGGDSLIEAGGIILGLVLLDEESCSLLANEVSRRGWRRSPSTGAGARTRAPVVTLGSTTLCLWTGRGDFIRAAPWWSGGKWILNTALSSFADKWWGVTARVSYVPFFKA
jgi:hypothetical protein